MLLEQAAVAVVHVLHPRYEDAGVAPGRDAGEARVGVEGVWGEVGIASVVGLGVAHVGDPLGEERGHVHVEAAGLREGENVAHPAETLVALRAIGRRAVHVGALRPDDVLPEAIDHRVGAFELPDLGRVGVDDATGEGLCRRACGEAGDLDVAEAVIGEVRFVDFRAFATRGVAVGGPGTAQVGGVDRAVGVEDLGVPESDFLCLLAVERQAAPAG